MRLDIDFFQEITDSLTRNKRRSLLTGFGIFWGLFMLLFLVGGGKGVKGMLEQNFEGFATNSMIVYADRTTKPYKGFQEGRDIVLTTKDVQRLKSMIPELATVTPEVSRWGQTATVGSRTANCQVSGREAVYAQIQTPDIRYGRYITEEDVRQERKVCVIGKRIYQQLFPGGGNPCGQFIQIGDIFFQIVGVDYCVSNVNISGNAQDNICVPITVSQRLYNFGEEVELIYMVGKEGVKMVALEKRLRSILAREHIFDPTDDDALEIFNSEQIFNIVDTLFRGLNFFIWLIGIGTLLAGSIGVSNIMMVTVRERTTEIGIRRAIGATPRDILVQIMMESGALTLTAGTFGIVFSVFVLNIFEKINMQDMHPSFQISFTTAILAELLLVLLGVLAGLPPALRAMRIKPVDAMRDE